MTKAAKRVGRPTKPATTKRVSLGLKVTAEVKQWIEALAQASGRTQSQEAEHQIERARQYEAMLERMRMSSEEMERVNVDVYWRQKGYTPVRTLHGVVWFPPGFPFDDWFRERKRK